MILERPPRWISALYPKSTWRFFIDQPFVALTFDDGPHPDITPFVLDLLKTYNWKATFLCVGENIQKYPEIYQRILNEGHEVGNHTMKHEKGRVTSFDDYSNSFERFEKIHASTWFRPPYGSITNRQRKYIGKQRNILMWSWCTYDFDEKVSDERILEKCTLLKAGDIIVLHDNPKFAQRNLKLFPALFEAIQQKGFQSHTCSELKQLSIK